MSAPRDPFRVALQRLGLGRYESLLYAALVERSPQGASALARASGLARSSVYTALAALADKGLVGTTHEGGIKQFVAEGHSALLDLMRREEQRAGERVKTAAALEEHFTAHRRDPEEGRLPHVVHFQGQEGLRRVYLTMLRQAPRGAVMSILRDEFIWSPEWSFVTSAQWRARVRSLRSERAIETRLLVNRSAVERERSPYYRGRSHLAWRYLPGRARVDRFAIYVLGEMVAVLSTEPSSLIGIQIANPHLSRNFQTLFDLLWRAGSSMR